MDINVALFQWYTKVFDKKSTMRTKKNLLPP